MKQIPQLHNIQYLRAFAAIAISMHHSIYNAQLYDRPTSVFRFLENWGTSSVDLFFVISGFIMVYIQHYQNKNSFYFFLDRVGRVVPTYWFYSILMTFILFFFPFLFNKMQFSIDWSLSSLFFLSNVILDKEPIIFVGWTLEYEMLFYLSLSLFVFFKSKFLLILYTSFFLAVCVFFFNTSLVVLNFIYGMFACIFFLKINLNKNVKKILFIFSIFFYFSTIWIAEIFKGYIYIYGIASGILVYSSASIKQYSNKFFLMLGDRSYSIYLIQVFSIPALFKLISLLNLTFIPNDVLIIFVVLMSVFLGVISFNFTEKKFNFLYKKIIKSL